MLFYENVTVSTWHLVHEYLLIDGCGGRHNIRSGLLIWLRLLVYSIGNGLPHALTRPLPLHTLINFDLPQDSTLVERVVKLTTVKELI